MKKMTNKCPKCNVEMPYLFFKVNVEQSGKYDGEEWNTRDYGDWNNLELFCPHCDELVARSQEEADKILKNPIEQQSNLSEKV